MVTMKTRNLLIGIVGLLMLCGIATAVVLPTVDDCWIMASTTDGTPITQGYSTLDTYMNMTCDNPLGGAELSNVWIEINESYLSESIRDSPFNLSQGSNYLDFEGANTGVGNWSVFAWVNDSINNKGSKDCGWFEMLDTTTTTTTTTTTLEESTTTTTLPTCEGSLGFLGCDELNESVCGDYYAYGEGAYQCEWSGMDCVLGDECMLPCDGTEVNNCSSIGSLECDTEDYYTLNDTQYFQCYYYGGDGDPAGCYELPYACGVTTTTLPPSITTSTIPSGGYLLALPSKFAQLMYAAVDWAIENFTMIMGIVMIVVLVVVGIFVWYALTDAGRKTLKDFMDAFMG